MTSAENGRGQNCIAHGNTDIFETFVKYFIHPQYYTCHKTYAVVTWSVDETPMSTLKEQNETEPLKKHVEHVVLEKIDKQIKEMDEVELQVKKVNVTLYMNYSPCNFARYNGKTCCEALIDFMERKDIDVTLVVVFVSLYNILRESCIKRCTNTPHTLRVPPSSEQNKLGLQNLVTKLDSDRFKLRTFSKEDWECLRKALDITDVDYEALLAKLPMAERQKEDERMKKDLEAIVRASVPKPEDKRGTAEQPGASVPKPEDKRGTAEQPGTSVPKPKDTRRTAEQPGTSVPKPKDKRRTAEQPGTSVPKPKDKRRTTEQPGTSVPKPKDKRRTTEQPGSEEDIAADLEGLSFEDFPKDGAKQSHQ